VLHEYQLQTENDFEQVKGKNYDAVILTVSHDLFRDIDLPSIKCEKCVVYDVKAFLNKELVDSRL